MWFVFALISTLAWGAADLFYKKGADENDKFSHLKTTMIVGVVMGLHATYTLVKLIAGGGVYNPANIIIYLPVSLMYILSMTVGYFGLRYLELSVSSPVQNSSGGISCLLCVVFLGEVLNVPQILAVVFMVGGVVLLGVFEKLRNDKLNTPDSASEQAKYRKGLFAFLMPVGYAVLDSLGTFFDAYYLDDFSATPLVDVTEDSFEDIANMSYEFTFLICAVIIFVFLKIKKQKIVESLQKERICAAVFETAGQATYVYAMSGNGAVAAPMIASYSIVSLILSRIVLKEKLSFRQYMAIVLVIAGIVILGVLEGLAE